MYVDMCVCGCAHVRCTRSVLKSRGFSIIRLGVIWAGAQPTSEYTTTLDPDWLSRLVAILELCERHQIRAYEY